MDITEIAKHYAEGKALNALTSAIEQAFIDGYNDALSSLKETDEKLDSDIEYVDMCLPSGTKWSRHYLYDKNNRSRYFTYEEATRLNIPTEEQFDELIKYCKLESSSGSKHELNYFKFLATNGNTVYISNAPMLRPGKSFGAAFYFWLKREKQEGAERLCGCLIDKSNKNKCFMGYKLPVLLVSK